MKLFGRRSAEDEFWSWFQKGLSEIADIRTGAEPIIRTLRAHLDKVDSRLMWETGQAADGRRDFVVSADGVRDVAPLVHRLVGAAPVLPGWRVTAFRQAREPEEISRNGLRLVASEVYVGLTASPEGGPYNIVVLVPGATEETLQSYLPIVFILLDGYLGEETVMKSIGDIRLAIGTPDRSPHCVCLTKLKDGLGLS